MTNAHALDDFDEQDDRRNGDRRGLWNALTIAAVVIIVILALLMLRGCGSVLNSANHSSAPNEIIPVTGGTPLPGKVSVWLSPGVGIAQVMAQESLTGAVVDMGGGRFVIDVHAGSEVDAVRMLRANQGVYDAGRVYNNGAK